MLDSIISAGKSIVLFANGDKYIGGLRAGQKEGDGMCPWDGVRFTLRL